MPPRSITRRLEFDYGHRVHGHEGKCRHLHGHRGAVEITVCQIPTTWPNNQASGGLDNVGRVIDFSKIKELVGGWIDEHWDHNLLLHQNDPFLDMLDDVSAADRLDILGGKMPYVMPVGNPTAEHMAEELHRVASSLLNPHGIAIQQVVLYETPNSFATYIPPEKPC